MNEICNSTVLKVVLGPIKQLVNLIMIIGPILCICSIVYTFIKLMQNPDNKKIYSRIKDLALKICEDIIMNGTSVNIFKLLDNIDIVVKNA